MVATEDAGESENLRHAALLSSSAAQLVLDNDRRLVFSNNGASNLFGLSARDLGKPIQDLELSYRPLELRTHLDQVAAERHPVWVREVTWHRPSAESLTFDIQFVPLGDGSGNPVGTTIIFSDVSHHLQLQHELEHANRQLETAYEELQSTNEELETMNEELQSMNDELNVSNESQREQHEHYYQLNRFLAAVLGSLNVGVVAVGHDLRVLAWNARAEDLWGIRTDEARGQHLFGLDIGLPLEPLRPVLKRQLTDHLEPEVLQLDAVNRRGRAISVQVTVSKLEHPEDDDAPGALLTMDVVDG